MENSFTCITVNKFWERFLKTIFQSLSPFNTGTTLIPSSVEAAVMAMKKIKKTMVF